MAAVKQASAEKHTKFSGSEDNLPEAAFGPGVVTLIASSLVPVHLTPARNTRGNYDEIATADRRYRVGAAPFNRHAGSTATLASIYVR